MTINDAHCVCFVDEQPSIELDGLSDEPGFDPKVREHLEELNRYATKINQLEKLFEVNNINSSCLIRTNSVLLCSMKTRIFTKFWPKVQFN